MLALLVVNAAQISLTYSAKSRFLEYFPNFEERSSLLRKRFIVFNQSVEFFEQSDCAKYKTDNHNDVHEVKTLDGLVDKGHHLFFIEKNHFRIAADDFLTLLGKISQNCALSPLRQKQLVHIFVAIKIVEFHFFSSLRSQKNTFYCCY